jgi:RNA polymerase sigma factor (sigma-70 family)
MTFILEGKKNKLSVRPYFRERQNTFSKRVFKILKAKDPQKLHKFRINYMFVKWVLESDEVELVDEDGDRYIKTTPHYGGKNRRRLQELYDQILKNREMLCENNLPLAIHYAKKFWAATPQRHLEYMDLIQDSSRGLLEAIDNFVPPYRTVFRSTAIGRMGLNMQEDYSATLVKLSPKDRRILYRARKAKQTNADISGNELAKFVSESFKGTTAAEIEMLEIAANQTMSIDHSPDGSRPMSETLEDPNSAADKVEKSELSAKLAVLMEKLKTIEKKVLIMKHGEMYGLFPEDY